MTHRRPHPAHTLVLSIALVVLAIVVAGFATAPTPAGAATSCPTSGAKIYKKLGSRIVFTRKLAKEGTVYFACSTTYRKTVRLGADASELVDVIFTVKQASFYGNKLTFRSCEENDTGTSCQTVKANLKTGKKTATSTKEGDGPDAG